MKWPNDILSRRERRWGVLVESSNDKSAEFVSGLELIDLVSGGTEILASGWEETLGTWARRRFSTK